MRYMIGTWVALLFAVSSLIGCDRQAEPPRSEQSQSPTVQTDAQSPMAMRLATAMASASRPIGDSELDATRKPIEVLTFFGIDTGMTTLDVNAGVGYYVELLAAAVGPTGRVYAQNDVDALTRQDGAVDKALESRLANNRLPNVERIDQDLSDLGLSDECDAALLLLTLHDFYNLRGEVVSRQLLGNIYTALKPGGILGIIDHVGEASRSVDARVIHRIEKGVAERLITDAGFVIEAESDTLANPDDPHTQTVFHESIRRRTDRFVIRARKPFD